MKRTKRTVNKSNFVINGTSTIREALVKIANNKEGVVLLENSTGQIYALATDGDIRSGFLNGHTVDSCIDDVANKNFFCGTPDTSREVLLKQLDGTIKFIPIIDDKGNFKSYLNKNSLPKKIESNLFYRSKAPVRISFGGGGSDVSKYFNDFSGAVINATISLHSHASLKVKKRKKSININSLDLNESIEFKDLNDLISHQGRFSLINAVIKAINPTFGFDLFLRSDYPMSSGLGGSAVVAAVILGCFNQLRNDKWDMYELAEMAFQAERIQLGIAGGWQDQYATVFGGFNFMEFNKNQNIIHPLRMPEDAIRELEESLILCYTGLIHDSGKIHSDQSKQTKLTITKDKIQKNVKLTYKIKDHLLKGQLHELGDCLNEGWNIKKSLSNQISNSALDDIYKKALENGITGGKLLGAGGGGYYLFYVSPFKRHEAMKWIVKEGLVHIPFVFDNKGLQSWTVREK